MTVIRQRLVEDVSRSIHSVLIEAGGGFGKTLLTEQVMAAEEDGVVVRLARCQPVDLESLVSAIAATTGTALSSGDLQSFHEGLSRVVGTGFFVVDNVEMLTDGAARWLAELTRFRRGSLRLLASSRLLPDPLAALEFQGTAQRFNTQDLLLDEAESEALAKLHLGDDDGRRLAPVLYSLSGGWVALFQVMARRLSRSPDRKTPATMLAQNPDLIRQLIDHYAADLTPHDRHMITQVAAFPKVNDELLAELGEPGLLRRFVRAGVPFAVGADGWSRLCQESRATLTASSPLDPGLARRAAQLFLAQKAESAAASLLIESGQVEAAARLIAESPTSRVDQMSPNQFISLITRLGTTVEEAPRVLLHLARTHRNLGQLAEEREVIDWAFRITREHPQALAVEVEGELLNARARSRDARALPRVEELLLDGAREGGRAHASLLEALGICLSLSPEAVALRRAEDALRQAAVKWGKLDDTARVVDAQRNLATQVLTASGRTQEGTRLLGRLSAASDTPFERMLCQMMEARLLALGGDTVHALDVLQGVTSLADLLGIDWVSGHVAWTRLIVAANNGDRPTSLQQLAVATAHLGQLINDGTGLLFLCESADACAGVGADVQSRRLMNQAFERRDEDPALVSMTEAFLEARQGKLEAGETLQQKLRDGAIPPGLLWKAELLVGYVHHQAGRTKMAADAMTAAFDRSAGLGSPELPSLRERRLIDILRKGLRQGGGTRVSTSQEPFTVRVLGQFQISRGRTVFLGPGRAEQLVKYLAVGGGHCRDEFLAEQMWSGEPRGVGQRRLKNVMTRVRQNYPGLVVRNGAVLSLTACDVDLDVFEELAQVAVGTRGERRVEAARAALDAFTGPLLPDDVDDEYIDVRREAVRRSALVLIDIVLEATLRADGLDDAVHLLERAMLLDPYNQERPLRVTRALVANKRFIEADALVARALSAAEELGATLAVEWRELSSSSAG